METLNWWWPDSYKSSKRSPWLKSTLSELDGKTKAMLKLIEEDANSFAEHAEVYYKKRPELISMVKDLYQAHRSLAERYDLLKSESGTRLLTLGSPFSPKFFSDRRIITLDHTSDTCSDTFDAESEVEDPEQYERTLVNTETKQVKENRIDKVRAGVDSEEEDGTILDQETEELCSHICIDEVMKLRDEVGKLKEENQKALSNAEAIMLRLEVEKLKEENKVQKAQLKENIEEKKRIVNELCNGEVMKLRVELERLMEEIETQKAQLMEKENANNSVSFDVLNLSEQEEKLKEEEQIHKAELMQKDEEKREVIRQLSFAIEVLKDQNTI